MAQSAFHCSLQAPPVTFRFTARAVFALINNRASVRIDLDHGDLKHMTRVGAYR